MSSKSSILRRKDNPLHLPRKRKSRKRCQYRSPRERQQLKFNRKWKLRRNERDKRQKTSREFEEKKSRETLTRKVS